MKKVLNIALVAHDGRKSELLEWVTYNALTLSKHNLYATGTTGRLIENLYSVLPSTLPAYADENFSNVHVNCLLSGPLGGDQQIGAMIAQGDIDMLIFFCDNLIVQGHQQDVGALSRLASLYNIAFATNRTTADMLLTSTLLQSETYVPQVPGCIESYKNRTLG